MIRMPHKETSAVRPTKGQTAAAEETQRFEGTVRRMLEMPPKPHSEVAKKEASKKAGPKLPKQ